jgi:SpoVK/Ycf46/Vps4 family AAA+-type ATPase
MDKMPKITAMDGLSAHNQVILPFLKVIAATNRPHMIVVDINRFLVFIFFHLNCELQN